jgi:hypothetical protein
MKKTAADIAELRKTEISRKTTELAGAFPYLFSIVSRVCEDLPHLVKKDTTNFYYQIGTESDPIPWDMFLHYGIGKHKDQKHLFLVELRRLIAENRPYWLPSGTGSAVLTTPFRIVLKTKDLREISIAEMERIKNTEVADNIIHGVILECFKPLFAGHFNGYQDGFVRQPTAWYAKIRNGVNGIIEADTHFTGIIEAKTENDMTALNVMKIWEYLALHDNGKGELKHVDIIDMLSHIAPSYLQKGDYVRGEYIGVLFNAFLTLAGLTHEYREELDFEILNIEIDHEDRAYALSRGHREGETLFMVNVMKHRLKAHNNILTLRIGRRGHAGE